MLNDNKTIKMPHNIVMEGRKKLMITGVTEVDSFDPSTIALFTEMGELTIKGKELHISQLSVDSGEVNVSGQIIALVYNDDTARNTGFFSKLFK